MRFWVRRRKSQWNDKLRDQLDRWLLDADANAYCTDAVIADYAASLKPFGAPSSFTQTAKSDRGGMISRTFVIRAGERSLRLSTFFTPNGQIAQYLVYRAPAP